MKRYVLLVLAVGMILSCKKNSVSPVNIIGKWELTRRYGGNIFPSDTTYAAGNGNILQFNSDGSYKQYTNGSLTVGGTFHVSGNQLYFDNNTYNDQTFYDVASISGDMLTIKPVMPDIATTVYDKISN